MEADVCLAESEKAVRVVGHLNRLSARSSERDFSHRVASFVHRRCETGGAENHENASSILEWAERQRLPG